MMTLFRNVGTWEARAPNDISLSIWDNMRASKFSIEPVITIKGSSIFQPLDLSLELFFKDTLYHHKYQSIEDYRARP